MNFFGRGGKEERDEQVRRMGKIYKTAKKVVVWLGSQPEGLRASFDALQQIRPDKLPSPAQVYKIAFAAGARQLRSIDEWVELNERLLRTLCLDRKDSMGHRHLAEAFQELGLPQEVVDPIRP